MATRRVGALLALLFALTLAACSEGPGAGGQLEGTKWILDAYGDDGTLTIVDEQLYADADFEAHRVSGFAGCNEFSALYRAGGRTLIVTNPSITMAACDEETMAFEQAYMSLLDQSRFYTVRRETLTIYDGDRNTILRFDAAPANPLLGKWVVDSFETAPGTVSVLEEGSEIDVVFRIGSLGGFAGCNSFSGVYGTNGTVVRVGKLAMTRVACDQALMDQDAAFVTALEGAAMIEPRGRQLNLTDRNGGMKVALVRPVIEEASPAPAATAEPSAEPTAKPTPTATPKPTPTPAPTATPTARPTPTPTAAPEVTPRPTASAPASTPPTASCTLAPVGGDPVAQVVYPGEWYTVTEPADLACRFFDPAEITIPADGSTPEAEITADALATSYDDAVTAATDPATWTVQGSSEDDVDGAALTCVSAVAVADTQGVAEGQARYACFVDVGSAGTVVLQTVGAPGDTAYPANAAIVSLMTLGSWYTPGG
jgi:heat shock protein HslJ